MEKNDLTVKIQGMTCACGRWGEQAHYKSEKAWPLGKSNFPLGIYCSNSTLDFFPQGLRCALRISLGVWYFSAFPSYSLSIPLYLHCDRPLHIHTQHGTVGDIYSVRANEFR